MHKFIKQAKSLIGTRLKSQSAEHDHLILNEAVSFDKHVIFIAVPKTGTTTVRNQLRPKGKPLIPNPHLNIMQVRDTLYTYLLRSSLEQNTRYPTEDVATDAEVRARTQHLFDTFFKFSAVRNPWARAVSLFFRREGIQVKDSMSFETFCEHHLYASDTCKHPTLHKNQFDWMSDENGDFALDYVYKVEDFAKAIREIEERTEGRLKLQYKESNANPNSRSGSYRDLYSDRTRKLIADRFYKDIDFFKFTF